eukprot:1159921-Pelagomonas_calceolata.AAC.6
MELRRGSLYPSCRFLLQQAVRDCRCSYQAASSGDWYMTPPPFSAASCIVPVCNMLSRWKDRGLHGGCAAVPPCPAPSEGAHLPGASHSEGKHAALRASGTVSVLVPDVGETK